MQTIAEILAQELEVSPIHVQNVIDLLDQGNTIPFIARYRKELHGSMDDTALRKLEDRLNYLRNLDQRRQEVKSAIEGQGKLTEELAAAIDSARTLAEVEDLYRPYKQKRRTRATVAREKGLAPLAELLLAQRRDCPDPMQAAQGFIDPEKGVETAADALQGANDIVAELLSDDAAIRKTLRELLRRQGRLRSLATGEEDSVYRLYYDFEQPLPKLAGHQILAINRGEKEGFLSVTVLLDRETGLTALRRAVVKPGSAAMEFIKSACEDAYDRLIYPSLEREARSDLTERACEGAIQTFALNLKPLLMQPPVKGHVTMGLDPGYAHGCKVAVIDTTGKVLDTTVVYPTYGQRQKQEAIARLGAMIRRHHVEHIAIGNGTASRETEQMAVELIHTLGGGVSYMMVSEAGASVYSASKLAAEQLLTLCGYTAADVGAAAMSQLPQKVRAMGEENAARQIGVGVPTLQDVVKELVKPGRDVRDDLPAPILRTDVLDIKDLKPGMELTGTVRNVVDFGVFVDIGVHQDGLVHISQICDRFIKHPSQAVAVGDVVKVVVLEVDEKKHRISLSMRQAAGKK